MLPFLLLLFDQKSKEYLPEVNFLELEIRYHFKPFR
jgi:hypothetical protein